MSSSNSARWKLAAGVIALVALIAWVLWPDPEPAAPVAPASAARPAPPDKPDDTGPAAVTGSAPALPASAGTTGEPAPDGLDGEAEGAAEFTLPIPTPDQIRPRPTRVEATDQDRQDTQAAALDLVVRSIERLEAERVAAERSGDAETAKRNRIRIERLRKRQAELAAAQDGDPRP